MEVFFLPGEAMFLTFKLANGSGWLTSHRLILCEHEPDHLEGHTPEVYLLKDFQKAQINGQPLTVHFQGKQQAKIQLQQNMPSILQEIKDYIERASENHQTDRHHRLKE